MCIRDSIESIEVLKDAASAAIYGSRTTNGVVLITTKQVREGKSEVKVNYGFSISHFPNTGRREYVGSKQYVEVFNEPRRRSAWRRRRTPTSRASSPTARSAGPGPVSYTHLVRRFKHFPGQYDRSRGICRRFALRSSNCIPRSAFHNSLRIL